MTILPILSNEIMSDWRPDIHGDAGHKDINLIPSGRLSRASTIDQCISQGKFALFCSSCPINGQGRSFSWGSGTALSFRPCQKMLTLPTKPLIEFSISWHGSCRVSILHVTLPSPPHWFAGPASLILISHRPLFAAYRTSRSHPGTEVDTLITDTTPNSIRLVSKGIRRRVPYGILEPWTVDCINFLGSGHWAPPPLVLVEISSRGQWIRSPGELHDLGSSLAESQPSLGNLCPYIYTTRGHPTEICLFPSSTRRAPQRLVTPPQRAFQHDSHGRRQRSEDR